MTTIVFLHIPKTAGQTIHHALVTAVGGKRYVSPVRLHGQAANGPQMPAGYQLYSGHIDWIELDTLPPDRFVFSVLRDPKERIASFYFFLLKEARAVSAQELDLPVNYGKRQILGMAADDYFFGGDPNWQNFMRDFYDNFYCSYFATRKLRGRREIAELPPADLIARARIGAAQLDGIYATTALARLEADLAERGVVISVADIYQNSGDHMGDELRWPKLLARLESDSSAAKLARFTEMDAVFMDQVLPG